MVSDLTQVERHERTVGALAHAEGAARVEHEQGGPIWADSTANLDVAHASTLDHADGTRGLCREGIHRRWHAPSVPAMRRERQHPSVRETRILEQA